MEQKGKYMPDLDFELPLDFEGDPLSTTKNVVVQEMLDDMNIRFGTGSRTVMFGKFVEKTDDMERPRFVPMPYRDAEDVLIRIGWSRRAHALSREREPMDGVVKYIRYAASNGGGIGNDYYVVPMGYQRIAGDDALDASEKPDYTERANEIRRRLDLYYERKEQARLLEAKKRAADEASSRAAKPKFVKRLREAQPKLAELHELSLKYGIRACPIISPEKETDTIFVFGLARLLYTERNVEDVERCVEEWTKLVDEARTASLVWAELETKVVKRFEAIRFKLERYPNALSFSVESDRPDQRFSRGFPLTWEGYKGICQLLEQKEAEAAEEVKQAKAAAVKAAREREAAALGLPQYVRGWRKPNARTRCGDMWVIRPDGTERRNDRYEEDDEPFRRSRSGYWAIWDQLLPGELALRWTKANAAAEHVFEVVYQPDELTENQLERVAEIQKELQEEWRGRRGMSSGKLSPPVGNGWGLFEPPEEPDLEVSDSPGETTAVAQALLDALARQQQADCNQP